MSPAPAARLVRHVGDGLTFTLRGVPPGWTAKLRTNVGRAVMLRDEIVRARFERLPLAGASWRDLEMADAGNGEHTLTLPLAEVGHFKAKAYALDQRGHQHWPAGADFGVSVHPSWTRTGNTIYCAFPRQFGPPNTPLGASDPELDAQLEPLDRAGYTVIPPSGKLRDLIRELPHITGTLGCRILHLLPVSPVPTTLARFGRFGSPYALQDLTAIDPALVEFDQKSTGVGQFAELAYATHAAGARLMLDLVINHTGWGSTLYEQHPEWFVRHPDGKFESPGAWGTVWEDLVELDQRHVALWEQFAEAFLTWCRRGVDAFRCDAGYKIPLPVWQFITARVRQEFPDTVFLLEGLGGSWEATNDLLGEGGMQWAYSELFQNFGGPGVQWYLDHALATCQTAGTLVHYSETHDNARLAGHPQGRAWSLHRNLLSALTSVNGGYGFTNGVEWLATEQVNVHRRRGLAWGAADNLLRELGTLNRLLADHPCFFDGATLTRLSPDGSPVYLLRRDSAEGLDSVLILLNTDCEQAKTFRLETKLWSEFCGTGHDLLSPGAPQRKIVTGTATAAWVEIELRAGAVHCLAAQARPRGISGENYRRLRALADWALAAGHRGGTAPAARDWRALAAEVDDDPAGFLARTLGVTTGYRPVITWSSADRHRITLIPPNHWLLLRDTVPFRARLTGAGAFPEHVASVAVSDGFMACLPPRRPRTSADASLEMERYGPAEMHRSAPLRFLAPEPAGRRPSGGHDPQSLVLLTNGRGAMTRLHVDLGRITSKYDCLLGANLDAAIPVDRHVFAKRFRVWVNADGFVSPLNFDNLVDFEAGPPAHWRFLANAGDGRSVELHLVADLLPDQNTVVLQFSRPDRTHTDARFGRPLPDDARVSLTARVDLEDRGFHGETRRSGGPENHFKAHCRPTGPRPADDGGRPFNGFEFTPANDRLLRVWTEAGHYHPQPEWSENLPHAIEAGRGQEGTGDAYSPGWFELPLAREANVMLVVSAELAAATPERLCHFVAERLRLNATAAQRAAAVGPAASRSAPGLPAHARAEGRDTKSIPDSRAGSPPSDRPAAGPTLLDEFTRSLIQSVPAYVVRRNDTKSVIAGYPWFLDWGRDSLICARGLIAAGMFDEVRDLLITFGRFEKDGTLPNSINGADASNRDTTDAPLWFGVVTEELAASLVSQKASQPESQRENTPPLSPVGSLAFSPALFATPVDNTGRTLAHVLRSIACGYLTGTPNGIRVDAPSGLVWSPSHFTWMDTNHPAGTPREGYPVEIQALWVRLLRLLARLGAEPWEGRGESWSDLARRTERSLHDYFWLEDCGWYADVLLAGRDTPARTAPPSNALRSNCLLLVALGVDQHPQFAVRARRMVEAAARHLVIPGALRSLAPLPVIPPLAIYGNHGGLINDPDHPYWPRYEGDEDTRRKPAYHNGTAWTWTFPAFCEALVKAYPGDAHALAAARAYLGSIDRLLAEGCLGHLPEILDGDAPHTHRGCDAQAWGITEALRVWRWLEKPTLEM